jgi:uncharacterized protein YbbK (DUF523 family)
VAEYFTKLTEKWINSGMPAGAPIKIGISSCLLGEDVRYDGQNKYDRYIVEALGQYVEFLPVCPETAIGLGVPRPPVRLLNRNGRISAIGVENPDIDISEALTRFGKKQAAVLKNICGYIFKSRSPSCGLTDTPISTGTRAASGAGLYTRQIIEALPPLPVTDEVSLKPGTSGNHFLERVFAFNRWQQLLERPLSVARLRTFHALHTPELERHDATLAEGLSDFLFSVEAPVSKGTARAYLERFMTTLQMPAAMDMQAGDLFERHTQLSAALDNHAD